MINELKRFDVVGYIKPSTREYCDDGECYDADEVDALITEKDAEIAQLKAENENLKYSVATLETDLAMLKRWRKVSEELPEDDTYVLATDGDIIWLCRKSTMPDGSPWFQPDGLPHIDDVTHWMPLPEPPKEDE